MQLGPCDSAILDVTLNRSQSSTITPVNLGVVFAWALVRKGCAATLCQRFRDLSYFIQNIVSTFRLFMYRIEQRNWIVQTAQRCSGKFRFCDLVFLLLRLQVSFGRGGRVQAIWSLQKLPLLDAKRLGNSGPSKVFKNLCIIRQCSGG